MAFPVKWVSNTMRGAAQINGNVGTLIAALDAMLVTGFGQVTALSVNVAGGIATASLQAGQSFDKHVVVLVEGATPAALNGEARVLTTSNTSITWATTAPDGAATGVITIKVAPVGWEKVYAAANKAVYRSTDAQGARHYYRVDDSYANNMARLIGYESMTDVDTGSGPYPTASQIAGGARIKKSYLGGANPVAYFLAADSRTVLIAISSGSTYTSTSYSSPVRGFGDMLALAPGGDPWCAAVTGDDGNNYSYGTFDGPANAPAALFVARDLSGIGSALATETMPYVGTRTGGSGTDPSLGAFPSSVTGQLMYCRRYVKMSLSNLTPRAVVPGVLHVPQTGVLGPIKRGDLLQGSGEFAGRWLLAYSTAPNSYDTAVDVGIGLIDITGPWR